MRTNCLIGLHVAMSNEIQDQLISQYNARVFLWDLNYNRGGADYRDLFANWQFLEQALGPEVAVHLNTRWRRLTDFAGGVVPTAALIM